MNSSLSFSMRNIPSSFPDINFHNEYACLFEYLPFCMPDLLFELPLLLPNIFMAFVIMEYFILLFDGKASMNVDSLSCGDLVGGSPSSNSLPFPFAPIPILPIIIPLPPIPMLPMPMPIPIPMRIPIVGERIVGATGRTTAAGLFAEGLGRGRVGTVGLELGVDAGDGALPGDFTGAFGALLDTGAGALPGDFTGVFGALLEGLAGGIPGDVTGAAAGGLAGDPATGGAIGDAGEFTGRSIGVDAGGNGPVLVGSVVSSPACTVGVFVGQLVATATVTGVSTGAATGADAPTGVEIGVVAGAVMGACAGAAVGAPQGNWGSVDN
jgi:hypothetical protein